VRVLGKIVAVTIHALKMDLEVPFAFSKGWVRQCSATLVEICTDEGVTGWGEAFAQGLEPPEISVTVRATSAAARKLQSRLLARQSQREFPLYARR
jgi:L-alanine-DL-glutamate epimerase-like enolase superfamily enzyme